MLRRNFLAASSAYALAALGLPDPEGIQRRINQAGGLRVGDGEVAAVRAMTKALGDTAAELGGGHARHLVVRYLTEDVERWLNGTYSEKTGRALYAATSQLVHLPTDRQDRAGLSGRIEVPTFSDSSSAVGRSGGRAVTDLRQLRIVELR